ncbi:MULTISPECIES: saccharopine dehydrogenase NADP-binding domain-containing protein [Cupriavidus]|uniref:saccharopine dehydrogenase NADP-binding domain-containing protein n=1 Tax=Cupriavidus sp. DF5525 TaxID=3160989 RepID=UPI0032DF15AC
MIEQIVIVGFGCIGQAVLPLLERTWPKAAITVVNSVLDPTRMQFVAKHGLHAIGANITAGNHETVLGPLLSPGAFLLNLAPSVCSPVRLQPRPDRTGASARRVLRRRRHRTVGLRGRPASLAPEQLRAAR